MKRGRPLLLLNSSCLRFGAHDGGDLILVARASQAFLVDTPTGYAPTHAATMEHYHKGSSQYITDAKLPNEVQISSSGKPYDLATRALHTLKDNPRVGVIISSCGTHVSKAVTVAELLKRRHPSVHQDTQIKYARVEDTWEPDKEELDPLKVVRRIPAISIKFTEEVRNDMGQHSEMDQSSVLIKDEPCKEEGTQGSKTGMHTQEIKIRDGDSTGKGGGRRRRRKRAPAQK